jgi:hypothetical protein
MTRAGVPVRAPIWIGRVRDGAAGSGLGREVWSDRACHFRRPEIGEGCSGCGLRAYDGPDADRVEAVGATDRRAAAPGCIPPEPPGDRARHAVPDPTSSEARTCRSVSTPPDPTGRSSNLRRPGTPLPWTARRRWRSECRPDRECCVRRFDGTKRRTSRKRSGPAPGRAEEGPDGDLLRGTLAADRDRARAPARHRDRDDGVRAAFRVADRTACAEGWVASGPVHGIERSPPCGRSAHRR